MGMHGNVFLTNEHTVRLLIGFRCLRASVCCTVQLLAQFLAYERRRNKCPVEPSLRTDNHSARGLGAVSPRNSSQDLGGGEILPKSSAEVSNSRRSQAGFQSCRV